MTAAPSLVRPARQAVDTPNSSSFSWTEIVIEKISVAKPEPELPFLAGAGAGRPSQGGSGAGANQKFRLQSYNNIVLVKGRIQQKVSSKKDPCCPKNQCFGSVFLFIRIQIQLFWVFSSVRIRIQVALNTDPIRIRILDSERKKICKKLNVIHSFN